MDKIPKQFLKIHGSQGSGFRIQSSAPPLVLKTAGRIENDTLKKLEVIWEILLLDIKLIAVI
jgi:hypothetical protein